MPEDEKHDIEERSLKTSESDGSSAEKNSTEYVTMDDIKSGKADTLFTESVDDEIDERDVIARGKFFAVISYMSILCLVPVFFKRKNRFAIFHAKQGIILFIWYFVAATIKCVFSRVYLLGAVLGPIGACVKAVSILLILLLSIVGIYEASTGSYWRLPMMLGDWAEELEIGKED